MVFSAGEASVQSTELGFSAGLDGALSSDGVCPVARSAIARDIGGPATGYSLILHTVGTQCGVVLDVFWAKSPLLGMINIVPQLLIILATIMAFARIDRFAAWCLVPLAGWVAYASVLNAAIWQLNG